MLGIYAFWRQQTGVGTDQPLGDLVRHITTPYHLLPPHTPSMKSTAGSRGDKEPSSRLWVISPQGDAMALPHSLGEGKELLPPTSTLKSPTEGVREPLRKYRCLWKVNLWHVSYLNIRLDIKRGGPIQMADYTARGKACKSWNRIGSAIYIPGKFPLVPEELQLCPHTHTRDPTCGCSLLRTEKQNKSLLARETGTSIKKGHWPTYDTPTPSPW